MEGFSPKIVLKIRVIFVYPQEYQMLSSKWIVALAWLGVHPWYSRSLYQRYTVYERALYFKSTLLAYYHASYHTPNGLYSVQVLPTLTLLSTTYHCTPLHRRNNA